MRQDVGQIQPRSGSGWAEFMNCVRGQELGCTSGQCGAGLRSQYGSQQSIMTRGGPGLHPITTLRLLLHSKGSKRFPAILNPGSPGARASRRQEALEVT